MRESSCTKSILTVVGARPQFIKAAAVARALQPHVRAGQARHAMVHTGQHYDTNMSKVFFEQLSVPPAEVNLGVTARTHGRMTAEMLEGIEQILMEETPDWLVIYGDTNSTLAGALAAAKLSIRIAHVEAGLRSFNRRMPEEVNRVLSDRAADLLLCPTASAVDNLRREGITAGVALVGDVMLDLALYYRGRAEGVSLLPSLRLQAGRYVLATCHRQENTDDGARLAAILDGLAGAAEACPVVWPMHPRTARRVEEHGLTVPESVRCIEPIGYLEMLDLVRNARTVCTDSGGLQKEAYFYGVPCVTMRSETEWVETVDAGWNAVVDADTDAIAAAAGRAEEVRSLPRPELFGDGGAAERIVDLLLTR
jgi:UDP-GlcNAc3NAcA epimerase